jgi:hypothetical protein
MFGSSSPPVVWRREYVLFTLCVLVRYSDVQHILCFCFCTLCCQFHLFVLIFIAPSVFSNFYINRHDTCVSTSTRKIIYFFEVPNLFFILGPIEKRKCALQIGHGEGFSNFFGIIDEVSWTYWCNIVRFRVWIDDVIGIYQWIVIDYLTSRLIIL